MAGRARLAGFLRSTVLPRLLPCPPQHAASYVSARGMASSKLFIGGLSFSTDEASLRDAFSLHGEVLEAKVILDHETGRSRGFGFVTFFSEGEAEAALQKMDGQPLNGRMIRVNYAINKPREPFGGGFQRGFSQPNGQGDTGFGASSPSGSSSYGSSSPKETNVWDDDLSDPVPKSTSPQKSPREHESGSLWEDDTNKGFSNASYPKPNSAKVDDEWNGILGNMSTNTTSSTGAKEGDWDFKFEDFDKKPSPTKGGSLDDLNVDSWDDILGTKSDNSNFSNKPT